MCDSNPIPLMDECAESLEDATSFSTPEANSGYWEMEISRGVREKTFYDTLWIISDY